MLLSHQFGSPETLNRARFWLTWHGFEIQEHRHLPGESTAPNPRLAVRVNFTAASAVLALIDSIEHSDPNACPGLHENPTATSWRLDKPAEHAPMGAKSSTGSPIHWESPTEATGDADAARVAEYMFGRWE